MPPTQTVLNKVLTTSIGYVKKSSGGSGSGSGGGSGGGNSSSVDRWTQVVDLYVQSVVYHSEYRTIRIQ